MKEITIEFFKWCNEPVFKNDNELGSKLRVQPQFPNYDTYIVIGEDGYSILPDKKELTAEELYEYWENTKEFKSELTQKKNNLPENLLDCDGKRFSCKIEGVYSEGVITVEYGKVYLCQNQKQGYECINKKGYYCSWSVIKGRKEDFEDDDINVTEFELID